MTPEEAASDLYEHLGLPGIVSVGITAQHGKPSLIVYLHEEAGLAIPAYWPPPIKGWPRGVDTYCVEYKRVFPLEPAGEENA